MLEQGTRLSGRYRVESVLGQGGMAAVYLARVEALGDKPVAIKEMGVNLSDPRARQAAVEQFRQEASFLANLEHPNLVGVTDFFEEDGRHYLVMAYIKGETLADMLAERGRSFPVDQVLEWAEQLCSVLNYLHTQDPPILFRDLKPSNIMVDESGRVRLIDFGIARVFQAEGGTATFLQGVGSAGYSPLEQYQGTGSTDQRSDIYSLGATLFELLTGKAPPSPIEIVSEGKRMQGTRELNPAVPPALDQVVHRMTALHKEDRFATVEAVAAALGRAKRSLLGQGQATDVLARPGGFVPPAPPTPEAVAGAYDTAPMAVARSRNGSWLLWVVAVLLLGVTALGLGRLMSVPPPEAASSPTPRPSAEAAHASQGQTRTQAELRVRHQSASRVRTQVPAGYRLVPVEATGGAPDITGSTRRPSAPSQPSRSASTALPQPSYPTARSQPSLPTPSYPTARRVEQRQYPRASPSGTATNRPTVTGQQPPRQRYLSPSSRLRRWYLRRRSRQAGGPQAAGSNQFDHSPIGY